MSLANPYFQPFLDGLETRFPDDSSQLSMSEWISTHTHLRGKPFSYKGYEFQRAIADDMHPDLSVIKISQIGLTEVQFRKFFGFLKRNIGTGGIFALPNQPMRDRLSVTRVKTLIESEPIFNGPLIDKPTRRKDLYQVDQSFGYMTGNTESEATSISADILFSDEVDLSDQQMLGLFQSRLQGSKFKITQKFSTPTYTGYGIDASYQASDQHEYHCRCSACNHWQVPKFELPFLKIPGLPSNLTDLSKLTQEQVHMLDLSENNRFIVCEKCSSPLDIANPDVRSWIAKYPSRYSRGYRVRPFSLPSITVPYIINQLMQYQRADNIRGWFNTVIGEPFNDANARIGEEDINSCFTSQYSVPNPRPSGLPFYGVDVGQTCHVVIGTWDHIFEFAQVPQREIQAFLQGRINTYGVAGGAIDLYPYTPTAEAIRDVTHSKIIPVSYATTAHAPTLKEVKDEFGKITSYTANRTRAIDKVSNMTRNRSWRFSGFGANKTLITNHMRDMIRVERADEPPTWQKMSGSDHYLHAMALHQLAVRIKEGVDFNKDADPRTGFLFTPGGSLHTNKDALYRMRDQGILGWRE